MVHQNRNKSKSYNSIYHIIAYLAAISSVVLAVTIDSRSLASKEFILICLASILIIIGVLYGSFCSKIIKLPGLSKAQIFTLYLLLFPAIGLFFFIGLTFSI